MSHLNYCSVIWHFCGTTLSDKLERVQIRALRAVYVDYESESCVLLERANMTTLKDERVMGIAIMTFQIENNLCPCYLENVITHKEYRHHLRSGQNCLVLPHMDNTKFGLNSFTYAAPRLWNKIPINIIDSQTLTSFKETN